MCCGSILTSSESGSCSRRPMRDGAAQGGVEVRELLAADRAGRVDAGAGLVDDHVGEVRRRFGQPFEADRRGGGGAPARGVRNGGPRVAVAVPGVSVSVGSRDAGRVRRSARRPKVRPAERMRQRLSRAATGRRAASRRDRGRPTAARQTACRRLLPARGRRRAGGRSSVVGQRRRRAAGRAGSAGGVRGRRSARRRVAPSRGRRCRCRWR